MPNAIGQFIIGQSAIGTPTPFSALEGKTERGVREFILASLEREAVALGAQQGLIAPESLAFAYSQNILYRKGKGCGHSYRSTDALLNLWTLSVLYLEWPKEVLCTSRVQRWVLLSGYRQRMSAWLAVEYLLPIDNMHIKMKEGD